MTNKPILDIQLSVTIHLPLHIHPIYLVVMDSHEILLIDGPIRAGAQQTIVADEQLLTVVVGIGI
jgi:hypothetical protein